MESCKSSITNNRHCGPTLPLLDSVEAATVSSQYSVTLHISERHKTLQILTLHKRHYTQLLKLQL